MLLLYIRLLCLNMTVTINAVYSRTLTFDSLFTNDVIFPGVWVPSAEQLDNADHLLATDKSARIKISFRHNCVFGDF